MRDVSVTGRYGGIRLNAFLRSPVLDDYPAELPAPMPLLKGESPAPVDQMRHPVGREPAFARLRWPGLVVLAVVLANLPALAGIVDVNPLGPFGHAASQMHPGFLPGFFYADPEAGWTAQSLGHLSAMDWLHGRVPWWNPFEGLGSPLAAEMNAASLFPPTLLLALQNGQLYFHMLLEATAGIGTYLLLRELSFRRPLACLGGVLFGLNGTYALFGHAAVNPICFLPFMLLGTERLYRRRSFDPAGFATLSLALALSIYAGFPETAYLDGLLVGAWFVLRLAMGPEAGRLSFLSSFVLALAGGALLSAPLLVAFAGYLPHANLGGHSAATYARDHISGYGMTMLGLPYLYGPLMGFPSGAAHLTWAGLGGYVTAPALALGALGAVRGRRDLALRIALAVVFVVMLLWTFGVADVQRLFDHVVPLATHLKVSRYDEPVIELSLVLLACYGLDALFAGGVRYLRLAAGACGLFALAMLAVDLHLTSKLESFIYDGSPTYAHYAIAMVAWAGGLVVLVTAAGIVAAGRAGSPSSSGRRAAAAVLAALVALDALVMFGIPQLSAPRSETIDTGPARFLAKHLQNGRFFSLGTYLPNYGSYFGIASADSNDLPIPKLWASYVPAHLAKRTPPGTAGKVKAQYFGSHPVLFSLEESQLVNNLPAYEAIDVRYVVLPSSSLLFSSGTTTGVRLVYRDRLADIYALPHPRPFYFSSSSPGCKLTSSGRDDLVANCPAPARLVRSELYMPGWSATVNGKSVPIRRTDDALQSIPLGSGRSIVSFSYAPKHIDAALGLFGLGAVISLGLPLGLAWRRRKSIPV